MARQAERREATRAALIAAARECFVAQGFEATSTEAILARAGVSKGALYHHFDSKTELLAAVFETISQDLVAKAGAAAGKARAPRKALAAALKAWLRFAIEPEPRRILLDIGPAVLGFARARQIEDEIAQAPIRRAILRVVERDHSPYTDIDLVARLLSAAVSELALVAMQRGVDSKSLAPMDDYIAALIDALLPRAARVSGGPAG